MSELSSFRDYCRRMAEDPDDAEAWLWRQLADEIDSYLEPAGGDLAFDLFGQATTEPREGEDDER